MRSLILISAVSIFSLCLTACGTTAGAEPERYAGLNCQQLSNLKKTYQKSFAQRNIFNDADINELERTNSTRHDLFDVGQSRPDLRAYEVEQEKDINSIRAASRLQGC